METGGSFEAIASRAYALRRRSARIKRIIATYHVIGEANGGKEHVNPSRIAG